MELTEAQAKDFWPLYDEYQKGLQKINERLSALLNSYAANYRKKSLTDEGAKKLVDEALALDEAETKLKSSMVPKLNKALNR
jgi:hypothetical protein